MVRRLLAIGLLAVVIAVGITVVAGRDDPAERRTTPTALWRTRTAARSVSTRTPTSGSTRTPAATSPSATYEMQPRWGRAVPPARRVTGAHAPASLPPSGRRSGARPAASRSSPGCDVAPEDGPGEFFLLFTPKHESVPFWVYNGACGDNGMLAVSAKGRPVDKPRHGRGPRGAGFARTGPWDRRTAIVTCAEQAVSRRITPRGTRRRRRSALRAAGRAGPARRRLVPGRRGRQGRAGRCQRRRQDHAAADHHR